MNVNAYRRSLRFIEGLLQFFLPVSILITKLKEFYVLDRATGCHNTTESSFIMNNDMKIPLRQVQYLHH
uniref:Uncharacterized protein n=1 Tax=Lepeophtheirus salmonis TaxID=72036 RepID=A0A0K2UC29_LEPSM